MKRRDWQTISLVTLLAGLLGFALVTYLMADKKPADPVTQIQKTAQTAPQVEPGANSNTQPQATATPTNGKDGSSIPEIFGMSEETPAQRRAEKWTVVIPRIIVRLTLAALLAGLLAFRPRKDM